VLRRARAGGLRPGPRAVQVALVRAGGRAVHAAHAAPAVPLRAHPRVPADGRAEPGCAGVRQPRRPRGGPMALGRRAGCGRGRRAPDPTGRWRARGGGVPARPRRVRARAVAGDPPAHRARADRHPPVPARRRVVQPAHDGLAHRLPALGQRPAQPLRLRRAPHAGRHRVHPLRRRPGRARADRQPSRRRELAVRRRAGPGPGRGGPRSTERVGRAARPGGVRRAVPRHLLLLVGDRAGCPRGDQRGRSALLRARGGRPRRPRRRRPGPPRPRGAAAPRARPIGRGTGW